MKKLILASTSPRRHQLLKDAGFSFDIEASNYEEDVTLDMVPEKLVQFLAKGKGEEVTQRHIGEDVVVLGADTFVSFQGKILGKPHTVERAREMLRMLSGKTHQLMTGFFVKDCLKGEDISGLSVTNVTFRELAEDEIDTYIATGEPLDRAGAYAIQAGLKTLLQKQKEV